MVLLDGWTGISGGSGYKNPVWETYHRGRIFDGLWIGEMGLEY